MVAPLLISKKHIPAPARFFIAYCWFFDTSRQGKGRRKKRGVETSRLVQFFKKHCIHGAMLKVNVNALLEKLNPFCMEQLQATAGDCAKLTHFEVGVAHFFKGLLHENADIPLLCTFGGVDPGELDIALQLTLDALPVGNPGRPTMSNELLSALQDAWLVGSIELGQPLLRSGAFLLALLETPDALGGAEAGRLLLSLNREKLLAAFQEVTSLSLESAPPVDGEGAPATDEEKSALEMYCIDFTQRAEQGEIDPVFGRHRETRQLIDILARRRKNNPIIVGDAGVGKTALVEGLALRTVSGEVPDSLRTVRILGLDIGQLEAGAGMKGEFEKRLKNVINEIKAADKPIILFIDEAHSLVGAGGRVGGSDAANLLKPALARGELRTIAATTWSEYKKYFERDQALSRRFLPVKLDEPSVEDAMEILRGLRRRYELDHGVSIRDDAVVAAAELSHRYISGRRLPDKAVDLLDTAAARVKVNITHTPYIIEDRRRRIQDLKRRIDGLHMDQQNGLGVDEDELNSSWENLKRYKAEEKELSESWRREKALVDKLLQLRASDAPTRNGWTSERQDRIRETITELEQAQGERPLILHEVTPFVVARIISDWTGIAFGKVQRDFAQTVLRLHEELGERIRGQAHALHTISQELRSAQSGLKDPESPLGVFLLVGPSGVGKTQTALALSDLLFGDEQALITINMSEFQERHSVSRLIGPPPGYAGYGEGGVLTEAVRRRPYSVLLLDEAEKAHVEVLNLFYQVFEKGVLADGEGRPVDFKNTIVFVTSNLASEFIAGLHASPGMNLETMIKALRPVLSEHFKASLLARMSIIPYFPLNDAAMKEIVKLKLSQLAKRVWESNKITLEYTPELVERIAARCTDSDTGARNIDQTLHLDVLPTLSAELLRCLLNDTAPKSILLNADEDGEIHFHFES